MKNGIELDLIFDSIKEFIRTVKYLNDLLSYLKSANREFKQHVKTQRINKQLNQKEEE